MIIEKMIEALDLEDIRALNDMVYKRKKALVKQEILKNPKLRPDGLTEAEYYIGKLGLLPEATIEVRERLKCTLAEANILVRNSCI